MGHIAPPQHCCAAPSLSKISGNPSEKPAVVRDRQICRVTFAEIFGKLSIDEIKVRF